jgi:uncharacterized membrane protein YhaH (DUF805 family)
MKIFDTQSKRSNMKWYLTVFQNYANFNGRARRSEYWYFVLFNLIVTVMLAIVDGITNFPVLRSIYSLVVLLPGIAVGVRRMHDVGKNGWYLLIPFYNLVLACTEGNTGQNEYGSDPKQDIPTFDFEHPAV